MSSLNKMATNVRKNGDKHCLYHLKVELTFLCETCKSLICNKCITTGAHRGHTLLDLETAVQSRCDQLHDYNSNAESVTIPHIKEESEKANAIFKTAEKAINSKIKISQDRGLYLKRLIDSYMFSTETRYKRTLAEYRMQHGLYQLESRNALKKLDTFMKENNAASKSDNNALIIDLSNDPTRQINMEQFQLATVPNFIPSSNPEHLIRVVFGYIENPKAEESFKLATEMEEDSSKGANGGIHKPVSVLHKSTTFLPWRYDEEERDEEERKANWQKLIEEDWELTCDWERILRVYNAKNSFA